MTLLQATLSVGMVVGSLLSFYLIRAVGNVYLLLINASLASVAYAFTVINLKESIVGAVDVSTTCTLKSKIYVYILVFRISDKNQPLLNILAR